MFKLNKSEDQKSLSRFDVACIMFAIITFGHLGYKGIMFVASFF